MRTVRIVCVCTIVAEIFTLSDGPDKRLEKEARALSKQNTLAEAMRLPGDAGSIATFEALRQDEEQTADRPVLVVRDVLPVSTTVTYNTFRKADEMEITIPFALLPVPPHAIRGARIQAIVRQISDEDWANGVLPSSNVEKPDFFGTLKTNAAKVSEGEIPMLTLPFLDLVGVLSTNRVPPGRSFDESLLISQSITAFLVGTWGEGIPVRWVDPREPEPSLGKYRPTLYKQKKGKKPTKEVPSQYSYLDAISLACADLGCVARVIGPELQIAFAGTMYQGLDRSSDLKTTLLVGQVIENLGASHEYLGQKLQSVQVISFDPATHQQYTARFPKDPKNPKPVTVEHNTRAVVAPIVASLGQPGSQALEDSIVQIPLGPVENPELLPKVAEAIFHERARQRTVFTFTTHSPWSNPFDPNCPADILELRAGDNVGFGFTSSEMIPGEVRALAGQLSQGETQALLERHGVSRKDAVEIAKAVALVPVTDKLRVDEVKIVLGADKDAQIDIKLVTFTQIISDLQAKADGVSLQDAEKILDAVTTAADSGIEALRGYFRQARQLVQDSGAEAAQIAASMKKIDEREKALLKGQ